MFALRRKMLIGVALLVAGWVVVGVAQESTETPQPAPEAAAQPAVESPPCPQPQRPVRLVPPGAGPRAGAEPVKTRFYQLQHRTFDDVMKALPAQNLDIRRDDDSGALVVSGCSEALAAFEKALAQFDVAVPPPPQIQLTVYLINAFGKDTPPSAIAERPVPELLVPLLDELRGPLCIDRFAMVDSLVIRVRDGDSVEATSVLPTDSEAGGIATFKLKADEVRVRQTTAGPSIGLEHLICGAEIPIAMSAGGPARQIQRHEIGVSTRVDVQNDKPYFLTKAGFGGQSAGILVLLAKIVE